MSGCRSSPLLVNVFFLARSARIHSSRCPSSFIVLIVNLMNDVVIMVIILIIIVIIVIIITSNAITISSLIMVSVSGHFDGVTQHQDSRCCLSHAVLEKACQNNGSMVVRCSLSALSTEVKAGPRRFRWLWAAPKHWVDLEWSGDRPVSGFPTSHVCRLTVTPSGILGAAGIVMHRFSCRVRYSFHLSHLPSRYSEAGRFTVTTRCSSNSVNRCRCTTAVFMLMKDFPRNFCLNSLGFHSDPFRSAPAGKLQMSCACACHQYNDNVSI